MLNYILAQSNAELDTATGTAAGAVLLLTLIYLAVVVLVIASMWKVFTKAGKPGWAAIVPIYNTIVLLEIVGKPTWWIILLLIPFVNIIVLLIVINELSKSFGRGVGTTLGLIFLGFIFWPILAFGSAQYQGGGAAAA
ncbi:MAG: DUF5684 domain-containing protein [Akkermansiaceae bacterium]|nr:DUF5684 domain-containing protein [Akkermansiaceae bacterium]